MGTLQVVGGILCLIGGIWFFIVAFRESVVWGLLCLFLPIVQLIFLIKHFGDAWKPYGLSALGAIIVMIGLDLSHGF